MASDLSYRLASKLETRWIAAWVPPIFAVIGLVMLLMYFTGGTRDGGVLGFGIANLVLAFHLFTVGGFQRLLNQRQTPQH